MVHRILVSVIITEYGIVKAGTTRKIISNLKENIVKFGIISLLNCKTKRGGVALLVNIEHAQIFKCTLGLKRVVTFSAARLSTSPGPNCMRGVR